MNKLVEREAFIDSVRVKSAEFQDFYGFLCFLGVGKTAYRHVLSRVVREVEMVGKWFKRVFTFFYNITKILTAVWFMGQVLHHERVPFKGFQLIGRIFVHF